MNPKASNKSIHVEKILVDTGSEYTWVPAEMLEKIGIEPRKKDMAFIMANGQTITRNIGYAILQTSGFETVDEVVFGQSGDLKLLGARTLEGFAAVIDPRKKKLVAAGPLPAAPVPTPWKWGLQKNGSSG